MKLKNTALFFVYIIFSIVSIYGEHGKLLWSFDSSAKMEELKKHAKLVLLDDSADSKGFVFDSMRRTTRYSVLFKFNKGELKKGRRYMVSVDYKVLELDKGNRFCIFFIQDQMKNGKFAGDVKFDYKEFGKAEDEEGKVEICAKMPEEGEDTYFAFTSLQKGVLEIKSIKVYDYTDIDWLFDKELFKGLHSSLINGKGVYYSDKLYSIKREDFFPLVDKYGQFRHRQWEDKIQCDADFAKRIEKEKAFNDKLPKINDRDEFLGLKDDTRKFKATGKFRTEKVDGKWFLITPSGNLFWSLGINAVRDSNDYSLVSGREYMFGELDPKYVRGGSFYPSSYGKPNTGCKMYDFVGLVMDLKYGKDAKDIAGRNIPRMQKWGLNTIGAWSDYAMYKAQKIPYTVIVHVYPNIAFSPLKAENDKGKIGGDGLCDFYRSDLKSILTKLILDRKEVITSPYCIGVMVDNEPSFEFVEGKIVESLPLCPKTQPSKIEFQKQLKNKYVEIEKLNEAWNSKYKSWEDFLESRVRIEFKGEFVKDAKIFEKAFSEHYFKICMETVKEIVPDTLYISCRFATFKNPINVDAASKYADIVAINIYDKGPVKKLGLGENYVDKPILMGEFSIVGVNKGHPSAYGNCYAFNDEERAQKVLYYIKECLNYPQILGCHFFMWANQPITGRNSGGENYAFGIVDECDNPQWTLIKMFNKISQEMYSERLNGTSKD